MSRDMTRNWEDGLVALGAYKERLRIRRAQRDALRELRDYVESSTQMTSFLRRVVRDLDTSTRAPRKAKRK